MQYDNDGKLKHLFSTADLSVETIRKIFSMADNFKNNAGKKTLENKNICNAFFENSTRTLCSFELAEKKLDANVVNFRSDVSATNKGETLTDTFLTLQAMGFDAFVIRHQEENFCKQIAALVDDVAIINAGDGKNEHPTQALLDAYTIAQHKPTFESLSVGIFGDIIHSRVAGSLIHMLNHLGVRDLRLVGPKTFLPKKLPYDFIQTENNMNTGLKDLDVVVMLRMQRERMTQEVTPSSEDYFAQHGLTEERLKLAKPDAIVMHPGPMNREVEIASDVADGNQSVILEQVANGVLIRMAVLSLLLD